MNEDQGYKIEYTGLLALAQREAGRLAIDDTVDFVGRASTLWPEAKHAISIIPAIRDRADIIGAPADMIRGDDEIQQRVQQEQQAMQSQAGLDQLGQIAQGVKTIGDTSTDPNKPNALQDILASLQGATQQ
jgi:hypothetical protein